MSIGLSRVAFQASAKMLKLVVLCLGLQIKSEGIDFTFLFFLQLD